jgi:hypothetical protein
MEGTKDLENI